MPLYEYKCKKCDEKFETLSTIREMDSPVECPKCGSKNTDKLLSTFCASSANSNNKGVSCNTTGRGGT